MKIKRRLQNWLTKKLFCTISVEDVLEVRKDGSLWIGNKILPENKAKEFIAQAKLLTELDVWRFMKNNLRYLANQQMFNESKKVEELIAGKMMLYTISIQEKLLNVLINCVPKVLKKEEPIAVSGSPIKEKPEKSGTN